MTFFAVDGKVFKNLVF